MFGDIRKIGGRGNNARNGKTYHPQAAARKTRAIEREKYRATLSPQAQLKELDLRLGAGIGAVKERKRLANLIANPVKAESKPKGLTAEQKVAKKEAYNAAKGKLPKFAPQK